MAEQMIGRYKIEGLLGRGAMGVVYKAYDPVLDRYAAIKLMSTSGELDDELRARFFREARSAARLSNPNIIGIYDMGEDQERPFIAMEYIEGEDLRQVIKQRTFVSFERKLQLMIQICGALAYAHLHGVIHRDIKPGNIRLTRLGEVKILDFGLARLESSEMTRTGVLMGTPYYMSPEQAKGAREIDGRSDLFSVGVILYELLTYHRPFEGDTPTAVCFQIIREPHPPLSAYLPGCDHELESILDKALAKEPSERFNDCGQMATALSQFLLTLPERQAALREQLSAVESELATALEGLGAGDREGLDEMALNEVTMARAAEAHPGDPERSTVTPAERNDYGSLLVRYSNAKRRLEDIKEKLGRFRAFQEAYRASKSLFERREWQACLENLKKIEEEFPVTPEILSMRSVCNAELEKAAAERERRARLDGALAALRAARERGNLEACIKASRLVLDIDPDNREAAEMAQQATDRLERSKKVAELESAARQAWNEGDYETCVTAADQALALGSDSGDLAKLRKAARQAADRRTEINRIFTTARAQLERGEHSAVLTSCEQLLRLGAEREAVEQLQRQAQQAQELERHLGSLWKRLENAEREQDFEKMEGLAGEILEIEPENADASRLRQNARDLAAKREHVRELLVQATGLFEKEQFDAALQTIEELLEIQPDDPEALKLRQSIHNQVRQQEVNRLLADTEALLGAGNFQEAIGAAERVLAMDAGSSRAGELKRRAIEQIERTERLAAMRERARQFHSKGSWAESLAVASEGLELEPNDSDLLQIRAESKAAIQKKEREIRARAEKVQEALARGRRSLSAGRIEEAVKALAAAHAIDPETGVGDELERAIDRAKAEAQRRARVETIISAARAARQEPEAARCSQLAKEGLALDPENEELRQLDSWASDVLEKERLEREHRDRITASWRAAQAAMERQKYRVALRQLNLVLQLDADNREAAIAREEVLQARAAAGGKRLKLAYYAGGGLLALSLAVFGILPGVSTNQGEQLAPPANPQSASVQKPSDPKDLVPASPSSSSLSPSSSPSSKPTSVEEKRLPDVSLVLEKASRSLKDKDYSSAAQFAQEALALSAENDEAKRIHQTAKKGLDDIAAGKRQVRALISQGKPEQALSRLNAVLQLAPSDAEAAELARQLNNLSTALESADRSRAEMQAAKGRAEKSAAELPELLQEARRTETEAGKLYANRQFGQASARFYQARDAYLNADRRAVETLQQRRLEAARQPALQAQDSYEQSRRKAVAAAAEQLAADLFRQGDEKAASGRQKLGTSDFAGAQVDYQSGARLMDEAAGAATRSQERIRLEKSKQEAAVDQARGRAEQVRRLLEAAKKSHGAEDAEAASDEARALSSFQNGRFEDAALGFERSLKRYQGLIRDRENVREVVSAFARGYSARDLRVLKALWPSMDAGTEKGFKTTFDASQSVELSLRTSEIDVNQDSAVAGGFGRLRVTPNDGKPLESESTSVRFQLTRNGPSWVIQSYRFSSGR